MSDPIEIREATVIDPTKYSDRAVVVVEVDDLAS